MTKMQFQAAAKRVAVETAEAEGESVQPRVLEFSIAGQDFVLDIPTTDQVVFLSTATGTRRRDMVSACMEFLEGLMQGDGYKRFRKLFASGLVTTDLLVGGDDQNEDGIIDWIVGQVSDGLPPTQPGDSSPSQKPGGQRSTGRAPGKGSIPSASPSAGS